MALDVPCLQCGETFDTSLVVNRFAGVCPVCLLKFAASEFTGSDEDSGPPPLEVGGTFHGLEIVDLVGAGGMGFVYKARQPGLDRHVALKVLAPRLSSDPEFVARFNREAKAMAALSHPGIVQIYDFGKEADLCFLAMEFVDGASLRQLMKGGRLAPEKALGIVPQLCEALHFAHGRGVIHRDIKPENILVYPDGRVKIADFGLARILQAEPGAPRVTISNVVMGTPGYMAPEQYHSMKVDHRADIYSLGVIFYEMLTGALPVGPFDPPSKRVHIDFRLDEVVLKSLESEPERRYQHARDVKTDLEAVAAEGSAPEGYCDSAEARKILGVDVEGLGKLIETGRVRAYPFGSGFHFQRHELGAIAAFAGDRDTRRQSRLAYGSLICLLAGAAAVKASEDFDRIPWLNVILIAAGPVLGLAAILMAGGALTATSWLKGRWVAKLGAALTLLLSGISFLAFVGWAILFSPLRGANSGSGPTVGEGGGEGRASRFEERFDTFEAPRGFEAVKSGSAAPQSKREKLDTTPFRNVSSAELSAVAVRRFRVQGVTLVLWFVEAESPTEIDSLRAQAKLESSDLLEVRGRIIFGVRVEPNEDAAKSARDQLMEAARQFLSK